MPLNSTIRSASGSGSQHIGSVSGSITAHSGSGDLDIAQSGGTVVARTGSGSITIERAAGSVEAQAGSGDIRVDSVGGAIRARTGSGSVEMTQVARGDADVHRIGFSQIEPAGECRVRSDGADRFWLDSRSTAHERARSVATQTGRIGARRRHQSEHPDRIRIDHDPLGKQHDSP